MYLYLGSLPLHARDETTPPARATGGCSRSLVGAGLLASGERHVRADQVVGVDKADAVIGQSHSIVFALRAQDRERVILRQLPHFRALGISASEHRSSAVAQLAILRPWSVACHRVACLSLLAGPGNGGGPEPPAVRAAPGAKPPARGA